MEQAREVKAPAREEAWAAAEVWAAVAEEVEVVVSVRAPAGTVFAPTAARRSSIRWAFPAMTSVVRNVEP